MNARNTWHLQLVLLFVSIPSLVLAGTGKIVGTVVDEWSVPVPHMLVEACPAGVGFDLILPGGETDEHGKFVLTITIPRDGATDRWQVYAYDEKPDQRRGYYPRPSGFFGNKDARHSPIVTISPSSPEASVEVTLSPRAGALQGRVIGVTGIAVVPTFEFAWTSDPENWLAFRYENNSGPYRVLLPANTSLTLKVTSPGYKPWSYPGVISVDSGRDTVLDIQLDPDAKDPPKAVADH